MNTGLFQITLASPITFNFAPPKTPGDVYQRQPLTVSVLNVSILDNGTVVFAIFSNGLPPMKLWGPSTNPPYSSNPPGTGAGDTWTNSSAQAQLESILGSTQDSQTAALTALFPAGYLA